MPDELRIPLGYTPRAWALRAHVGMTRCRNSVVVAHRRSGKTVATLAQLVQDVFACPLPRPQGAYICPTAAQARKVAWPYLMQMLGDIPGVQAREFTLEFRLRGGGVIMLASGEQYDRLRGLYLDVAVVDESADCPDALISQVLLPALADRKGKLIQIGTVKGRGPFWKSYQRAAADGASYGELFLPKDTGALDDQELERLRELMGEESFRQEMLCDPDAAVAGSYWADAVRTAYATGRVTRVPYVEGLGVVVALDLGISDATAAWICQVHRGGEIRLLAYREWSNVGFMRILEELRSLEFPIDRWIGPHDLAVREFTSGERRIDAALERGIEFEIAPRLPLIDGIEAVRRALGRMVFDQVGCSDGLDKIALYRSQYDPVRRVLSKNPVHDYTSHAADALRYLVTGLSANQGSLSFPPIDYRSVTARSDAWQ